MRLSIFGGTGPTGLLLVEQAVGAGHDVVAYARSPDKLTPHPRLTVVEGLLYDENQIKAAVAGSDAVLSLLGPGTKAADTPPLVWGYRNIVAAMHQHDVRRLVALGTPSITDAADGKDWKFALTVKLVSALQPAAYSAIVSIGQIVRESDLDWTIVRVPFLSNGTRTDRLNVGQVGPKRRPALVSGQRCRLLPRTSHGDNVFPQSACCQRRVGRCMAAQPSNNDGRLREISRPRNKRLASRGAQARQRRQCLRHVIDIPRRDEVRG